MPIRAFPDPKEANSEGLIAVGGDLHPDSLLLAYRLGIFPWPMPGLPLLWFSPPKRAILRMNQIHIPKSLAKIVKKSPYQFTIDRAFGEVIRGCARVPRREGDVTWITPGMIQAYERFHQLGFAHSFEVWDGKQLVGGLYGVEVDGIFAGESMFRTVANASKLAVLHCIEFLKSQKIPWMDIQVMSPHMKVLGAEELTRDDFLALLEKTRQPARQLLWPQSGT